MSGRELERKTRRADDSIMLVETLRQDKEVADEGKARLVDRRVKQSEYKVALAHQLAEKHSIEESMRSEPAKSLFVLKTKSSDLDIENMFRHNIKIATVGFSTLSNNSESVAPILGYAAPTASALEREADEATAAAAASADLSNPFNLMKPKTTALKLTNVSPSFKASASGKPRR